MSEQIPAITYDIIKKIQDPAFRPEIPFYEQFSRVKRSIFALALDESIRLSNILKTGVDIRILQQQYKETLQYIIAHVEQDNVSPEDVALEVRQRLEKTQLILKKHLDDCERDDARFEFR